MLTMESLFLAPDDSASDGELDSDACNSLSMNSLFSVQYHLEKEVALSLDKCYILHLCWNKDPSRKVIAGLANCSSVVYDLETLTQVTCLQGHKKIVTDVKFSQVNGDLAYTSSEDGTVKLWDLRSPKSYAKEYKDASEGNEKLKPILTFDVATNDCAVVAGSELYDGDAFLLFWDVRSTKILGGYWESHTDDITQVHFHSTKATWVATGSTDGLLNVFDISKDCEDNALLYSINTESSVEKMGWFVHRENKDSLSCLTHTHDLQLWGVEEATPIANYSRKNIAKAIQRTCSDHCYLIDVHETNTDGEVLVIAGSTAHHGECLRILTTNGQKLQHMALLKGNKQIVRTSCYDRESGCIVTGGEGGILSVWNPGQQPSPSSELKVQKNRSKHKGHLPY